ncbi:hypothetical protein BDQ17DRAFT_1185534, partial [Cyathus striatus]
PLKEEAKPAKNVGRQSELSSQTDPRSVVESILNTDVILPLKTILGTSKEVAYNLQERLKVKNATAPTNTNKASHYIHERSYPYSMVATTDLRSEGPLIKIKLYHGGKEVKAVIDTGSQLNIINEQLANELVRMPMDVT